MFCCRYQRNLCCILKRNSAQQRRTECGIKTESMNPLFYIHNPTVFRNFFSPNCLGIVLHSNTQYPIWTSGRVLHQNFLLPVASAKTPSKIYAFRIFHSSCANGLMVTVKPRVYSGVQGWRQPLFVGFNPRLLWSRWCCIPCSIDVFESSILLG